MKRTLDKIYFLDNDKKDFNPILFQKIHFQVVLNHC